ncbi:MAG: Chromate transporter [Hyphomicrobiales bacterium]|nr:Chromate transporter [Hyphomicrobiales bacterium]
MSDEALILKLAMTFGALSLVSVGGAPAMIPEIHRLTVDAAGWLTNAEFARDFALSQTAPGPNFMMISLVGWRVAGFAGLMAATLAAIVPSSIIALIVGRLYRRFSVMAWFPIVKAALPPLVLGLIVASGVVTAQAAVSSAVGLVVVICTAAFIGFTKRNPMFAIAGGALVGILAGRLGLI